MNSAGLLRRLHHHRAWVNQNLLATAEKLSEDQLRREFAIGQASVWKSLLHLYAAEYVWLEALLGNDDPVTPGDLPRQLPGNQLADGAIGSFAELRERWAELGGRWEHYLAQLNSESLEEPVYKWSTSFGKGRRFATRRADVLMHVCTHAQYTTAQVRNMLRQLGVQEMPEVMLISLARLES